MKFIQWLIDLFSKKPKPEPVKPVILPSNVLGFQRGFTLDSIDNLPAILKAIKAMPFRPWVRIVFDVPLLPIDYAEAVIAISKIATIVGQPSDSEYSSKLTVSQYAKRFENFVAVFNKEIHIWEIGNEINGDWAGMNTAAQTEEALKLVKKWGKKSMLVPYFNTQSCMDTHGEFIAWLDKNLSRYVKENCDYVCTSFYGYDCDGNEPTHEEITKILNELGVMFYPAYVGIGEYGKKNDIKIMKHYLSYVPPIGLHYMPFGGYWFGHDDLLDINGPMFKEFIK